MEFLKKEKNIEVSGLELNQDNVQQCIYKGLPVIQGNAETELHQFPNQSFDYVILSQTLQAFYNPEKSAKRSFKNWKICSCINTKLWLLESRTVY